LQVLMPEHFTSAADAAVAKAAANKAAAADAMI
jgi:hypothetical protein